MNWKDDARLDSIAALLEAKSDPVNHPAHYTSDPSGVECIQITRHRSFNIGNAIKYLWRAGLKESMGQAARAKHVEDLRKAIFYINDEIERIQGLPEMEADGTIPEEETND